MTGLRLAIAVGLLATLGVATAAPGGGVVRVEHRDPSTAPTRGPANALVTIEYFFIPQTNAGSRLAAYRALERLQAKHPARIRIIYRIVKRTAQSQLPIAALEAHAQGKFFELMDALHAPRMNNLLTKDQALELARGVGIDEQRLGAAISEGRYSDVFATNDRRLERLHGSPPGVLFNSRVVRAATEAEYEREYLLAYERSLELIDQGYAPRELARAFDEQVRRVDPPFVVTAGPTDEDLERDPTEHPLASPPLVLDGLPSFGKADASAPVPVVVLCRPNDPACGGLLRIVRRQVQEIYGDEIRAVWAPWFDVSRDDAADLALLGDAARCAELVGSSPEELSASPGWRWITKQLDHANRAHGRRMAADKLIDLVSSELDIDTQRLSACRARLANATLDWIALARKSGVTRSPAIVIGGRIYEGLNDESMIHRLIEAELAPGVLGQTLESQFDRLLFFLASSKRR
ncbi:MAG: hypothetical protein M3680_28325 [Myxococcota bacterium]|nr:hypothetical protein [Myxococcota bacterium]